MNNRLLIVFNTCGLGSETIDYYRGALDSIYSQTFQDFDITVASCLHQQDIRDELQRLYPKLDIYCIDQKLPIHASFNHAIIETLKHRQNNYFGYTYFECGAVLQDKEDLNILTEYARADDIGIIVGQSDHDNGLNLYFGIGSSNNDNSENDKLFQGKDLYCFPPGFATNLHVAIYSRKLFDYYGKLQPDILAAHCMESLLSCMCGAVNTKWAMVKDVMIHHRKLGTIDSICFDPYSRRQYGEQPWEHPYLIPSVMERLVPGYELGLGYEACNDIMPPDEDKWDGYYAKDDRLAPFLKEALFLSEEELPHDSIKSTWMEGKR